MKYINDGVLVVDSIEIVYKCRKVTASGELLIPQETGAVWKCEFQDAYEALRQLALHYDCKYGDFELPEGIVIVRVVKECATTLAIGDMPKQKPSVPVRRHTTTIPTDSQITQSMNER